MPAGSSSRGHVLTLYASSAAPAPRRRPARNPPGLRFGPVSGSARTATGRRTSTSRGRTSTSPSTSATTSTSGPADSAGGARAHTDRTLPAVFARETETLTDYRLRYALHRSDPDLCAAHAAHLFVVIRDDHDCAGDTPENDVSPRSPSSGRPPPTAPTGRTSRCAHRSPLGARHAPPPPCPLRPPRAVRRPRHPFRPGVRERLAAPGARLRGPLAHPRRRRQERWLPGGWCSSTAHWNIVPQQVTFAQRRNSTEKDHGLSLDAWDGYPASRSRVLDGAASADVRGLVVLTGDVHVHRRPRDRLRRPRLPHRRSRTGPPHPSPRERTAPSAPPTRRRTWPPTPTCASTAAAAATSSSTSNPRVRAPTSSPSRTPPARASAS